MPMKIFLTDDHAMFLDGLIRIINSQDDLEVIGHAGSAAETFDKLAQQMPDLLVTDYNLPDDDGLAIVRRTKKKYPEIKIIVLSMHDEAHLVKEILKEGVDGYVLKRDTQDELVSAIRSVKNDKVYLSSDINRLLIQNLNGQEQQQLLTEREREILKLIAEEHTNKAIAEKLFISERTVETHRKNIFRKTKTNNLVGLIKYAYQNNLI
ncbi:MAG: response regulator transcription factor [Bacteroidota bacterium]